MIADDEPIVSTSEPTEDSDADKHERKDVPSSDAFGEFMTTGWAPPSSIMPARDAVADYTSSRRRALAARFPGDILVVPTGVLKVRSNDTDYVFRPGSDFYWLTGCFEPDAVLVVDCSSNDHTETLFIAGRSDRSTSAFYRDGRYGELWVGPRDGVEESGARFGTAARPLSELQSVLEELPPDKVRVLRDFDPAVDEQLPGSDRSDQDSELQKTLAELRLIKDDYEIARLREATAATAVGFEECVRALPTAKSFPTGERWLEGTFWRRSRVDGNDVGYGSIIGCGHHATTLHWIRNDGPVRDGDLALLDMGIESRSLYTADITRTLPINGTFTAIQRRVYDAVYEAQRAGLEAVKPGAPFLGAHKAAMEVLAHKLEEWGILTISAQESLDSANHHRRYTLHGVSHMLGIDVHDCTSAREDYWDGELREGMVLTVEPGLYFQLDDETVPAEYRGIGVRIEDDILVTADGYENLSHHLPTEASAVEAWVTSLR